MILDFVGVGVGPSNLSLAALAAPVADLDGLFLDQEDTFTWHPGAMLPRSKLQVSYLKDLVTLVDPTSRYSFLNFLVQHGRVYRALVANVLPRPDRSSSSTIFGSPPSSLASTGARRSLT